MTTLKAQNLIKSYQGRQVVRGVNLSVNTGEIVGLLGPNGAGKTTSFYMMVGLVKADSGNILINKTDVTSMPMHQRARKGIGYLPQETSIFRKLTVTDNILSILQLREELTKQEQKRICIELMKEFHIDHLASALAMRLSGGEKRRVEIARALAINPQFILLDEPFAGVDPISVIDIKRIIEQLSNRGIGILITDHNVRETLTICKRAYIMNAGQVIAEGTPDQILADNHVRSVYLGAEFEL